MHVAGDGIKVNRVLLQREEIIMNITARICDELWLRGANVYSRILEVSDNKNFNAQQALEEAMSSHDRSKILLVVADALGVSEELITAENEADVAEALKARNEKSLVSRLALKPCNVSSLANSILILANMEEPDGRVLKRMTLLQTTQHEISTRI